MRINPFLYLSLVLCLGCNTQNSPAPANQTTSIEPAAAEAPAVDAAAESDTAPPGDEVTVTIKDFDGLQELIASKRGKVVVMDCWSTWCDPCVKEFPGLVRLHEKYPADKLACISLSFNFDGGKNETPEEHQEPVLDFLRGQRATFDNVIARVPAEELYKLLGFKSAAVPAIFVYDRDGHIAEQFESADAKYSNVEKLVDELLEKP
jgi:thiol-disulfide isomerase/thioredoxin